jgi:hypothetical protein
MTKKYEGAAKLYNDAVNENDALVQAMIGESNIHWKVGYLESFLASAMYDMPELKERVESRILQRIKLGQCLRRLHNERLVYVHIS